MKSWRETIFEKLTTGVSQKTLVADPDGILADESVQERLISSGFGLIVFDEPLSFRFEFESRFRHKWDSGEKIEVLIISHLSESEFQSVPYDVLCQARIVSFALEDLFPDVSPSVVTTLPKEHLDTLQNALQKFQPGRMLENTSKDFVMRHIYSIDAGLISTAVDLLRVLLRRHYQGQVCPQILDQRFISLIKQNPLFEKWDLDLIVPSREAFFEFLQERWFFYLENRLEKNKFAVGLEKSGFQLKYAGEENLPFDNNDIRVFLDNLFIEGFLKPVPVIKLSHQDNDLVLSDLKTNWTKIGLEIDPILEAEKRVSTLISSLGKAVPGLEDHHSKWLIFARRFAELHSLANQHNLSEKVSQQFSELWEAINNSFQPWLNKRYSGLHNQPAIPPVMVHQIPRFLSRTVKEGKKVALVVIDGLSYGQWLFLEDELKGQNPDWIVKTEGVFAWIPTFTSFSRQAIFAGKLPMFFSESLFTTQSESNHWEKFWQDQGIGLGNICFEKGLGTPASFKEFQENKFTSQFSILGLVVDSVDSIMHGMELGMRGMYNQVKLWQNEGFLGGLIHFLHENGFVVFLTSDHGNIEATGIGSPGEGSIAKVRGERARLYADEGLRKKVYETHGNSLVWEGFGLPGNCFPLLAEGNKSFSPAGKKIVTHGGASIEEVIVPFVEISRN